MNEYLILPIIALGAVVILVVLLQNAFVHSSHHREAMGAPPSVSLSQGAIILFFLSGLFGLFLRLYGLDRSLWLDEFGTLWAVEGSMGQLLERVQAMSRERADSQGVTLSTESERNVALYRHLGYRVVGQATIAAGVETWDFFRPD